MARRTRKNPIVTASDTTGFATTASVVKTSAQGAKTVTSAPPALMAAPPTFTTTAGVAQATTPVTSDSAIASPSHIDWNSAKLRYLGGTPASNGSFYAINNYMFSANFIKATMRVSWQTDSPDFEMVWRYTDSSGYWRLMIDGQWAGEALGPTPADGNRHTTRVQAQGGVRKLRRYILELDQMAFGGLNIGPTDTVFPGPPPVTRAVMFGDSFVQGTGATRPGAGWAVQLANALGWDDVWVCGETGTGYLRPTTTTGFAKFIDRIATHLTPLNPQRIVIMGGFNDNTFNDASYTPAALGVAAAAFFQALYAALPNAEVFVIGPQTAVGPGQIDRDKNAAVKAAALAAPNVKVYMDPTTVADPWITGTGKVGSTTGVGNADLYTSADGAHPSPAGHEYYAARAESPIKSYYLGVA